MTLPRDWLFKPDHNGLDESGAIGTGEQTLADWACTVAVTVPGDLLEDGSFGADLGAVVRGPINEPSSVGAMLRGQILEDDRVAEVDVNATTTSGSITIPVGIVASDGPHQLSGPLTSDLIEEIIADMALEVA
jgi:hypothetical protein